jgi:hypothetical protein
VLYQRTVFDNLRQALARESSLDLRVWNIMTASIDALDDASER